MANTKTWPDPDTQVAQQGRADVHGVYLLDPTTQKAVSPTGGGGGGGPVTAVSGAFAAGAIVDLATLLTEFAELLTDTDNLATIAGAITAAIMQSNMQQVAGTTTAVNAGTINAGTQRIVQGSAATGTKSNVASNAGSVTILAANTNRKGAMIYNDSTQILYLDLSGGTASNSSYSVQVGAQAFFELPGPIIYNGLITGIWASANGNARITEFS